MASEFTPQQTRGVNVIIDRQLSICEKCGERKAHVVETRARVGGGVRRRKLCKLCGHKFSTIELSVLEYEAMFKSHTILKTVLSAIYEGGQSSETIDTGAAYG
jgi:protein-arginine kinase activator protein McsA